MQNSPQRSQWIISIYICSSCAHTCLLVHPALDGTSLDFAEVVWSQEQEDQSGLFSPLCIFHIWTPFHSKCKH